MTDLNDLAKRVEEGSGEGEQASTLCEEVALAVGWARQGRYWRPPPGPWDNSLDLYPPPLLTSLDAVVALVEERLPGWHWKIERFSDGWYVDGRPMGERRSGERQWDASSHQAKTECGGRCAAVLRALAHKSTEGRG